MLYMNALTSTEFRRRYASLTEPTFVTVNGHIIGQWLPNGFMPTIIAEFGDDVDAPIGTDVVRMSQAQRDELLNKINRSK